MMDRLAPRLACEQLAAFADGVRARRRGEPQSTNPYTANLLKVALAREWSDGWQWCDKVECHPG